MCAMVSAKWNTRVSCVTTITARSGCTAVDDDQIHDGLADLVIERGGGLVAEDQPRLVHERAGERDTLLLAAGERARERVEAILQPEFDEQFLRLRDGLAPLHARGEERHRRVLGGRQRGQQIVLLEDESEILPAKIDALLGPEVLDVFAEQLDLAAGLSSRPAITESSVVLPQPLGPTIESHLADAHVEIDAAQRDDTRLTRRRTAFAHRGNGRRCSWHVQRKTALPAPAPARAGC